MTRPAPLKCEEPRKPSGKQTVLSHYPEEKIAFTCAPRSDVARADEIGAACRAVIDDLFTINALFRLRFA